MKDFVNNVEKIVGSVAFVIMIISVTVNVFSRYILAISLNFAEEIAYIGFTYSVFCGVCLLYKKHALISIDIVLEKASPKVKYASGVFNFFLLSVLNLFLLYLAVKLTASAWIRPTAALRIPYTFIDIAAVFAFAEMSVYSILFLVQSIKGKQLVTAQAEFLAVKEEPL